MRGTTGYADQFRIHPLIQVLPRLVFQESGKVSVFGAGNVIMGHEAHIHGIVSKNEWADIFWVNSLNETV